MQSRGGGFHELEGEEVAEKGEEEEEGLVFGIVVLGEVDGFEQVSKVLNCRIMGL
jgi:hypothetical protein